MQSSAAASDDPERIVDRRNGTKYRTRSEFVPADAVLFAARWNGLCEFCRRPLAVGEDILGLPPGQSVNRGEHFVTFCLSCANDSGCFEPVPPTSRDVVAAFRRIDRENDAT